MARIARDTTVTYGGWGVSYTSGSGIDGVILNVYKDYPDLPNEWGGLGRFRYGDHHGRRFDTMEQARDFALERGYLQPFVRGVVCQRCRVVHRSPFGDKPENERPRTSWCPKTFG
jgi:hypothetical protein